jgi:hypothetical protein
MSESESVSFAFSMEDVQRILEEEKASGRGHGRDHRICKCGHPAVSHPSIGTSEEALALQDAGRTACRPGRQQCPCGKFESVMVAQDVRNFMFVTSGPAEKHALAKGAMKSWSQGKTAEWAPGVVCDGCKTGGITVVPIAISPKGRELERSSAINVLFCAPCRARWASSSATVPVYTPPAST